MSKIESKEAFDAIICALKENIGYIREQAAITLGRLKVVDAVGFLIDALKNDKDLYVRGSAARALGELKVIDAIEPLTNSLQDNEFLVCAEAAGALSKIIVEKGVDYMSDFNDVEILNLKKESHQTNRLLVVEQEQDIRELLGNFLEGEGFKMFLASDFYEGVEKILSAKPDVAFIDINMLKSCYLDFFEWIKTRIPAVQVITVTSIKDIEWSISMFKKAAYDYIAKPFKLTEVGLIATKALEKNRLINNNRLEKCLINLLTMENNILEYKLDQLSKDHPTTDSDTEAYKTICGSVAHSLKGEFLHIGNSTEEIRYSCKESEEVQEECEIIKRSLVFSQIIMRQLLDFLDMGEYRKEEVHISSLFEKTEALVRSRLRSKVQLNLSANPAVSNKAISADREQLIGILLELINNASKAMHHKGGVIELGAEVQNDTMVIWIKDNGPGIPTDLVGKIFKKQLSTQKGSGIGLFLSRKVINVLGGEMVLKNTSNSGTEFQLLFPYINNIGDSKNENKNPSG